MPNNPTVVKSVPVQSTLPVVGNLIAASNLPILSNTIASNNPTVALPNSIPVQISPPVPITPPTQRDREVLTKLPKSLLFDGCSYWLLFMRKFERNARMQDWSDEECGDCLGWCLTGKAVDFYALLTEGRETLPYAELMQRVQGRFGTRELPATAQGRFQDVQQEVGDWSDRVLTLATTAFRDLPYAYATEQAETKFSHGLVDKEAGKHVSLQLPTSMGDAMNMMKIYSHVQLACAAAPMDSQKGEREESRCVHEVRRAPSPGTVSGLAADKLTQVVDRILGSVERLSNSCGSQDENSRVRQPVQVFRFDGGERLYGKYAVEGSNEDGTQNLGFNKQCQVRCPEGTVGGGPRGHRNQHAYERGSGPNAYHGSAGNRQNNGYRSGYPYSNVRPEGSKRGRYGSNWGEYPVMARRGISCLFGNLEHFRCGCRVGAGSVANNELIPLSVTEAAEQQSRPEVGRVNQLGSAAQFCLKVKVGDVMVDAVIDSAAEVSLISDRVYKAMKQPPLKQRDVKLLMTGRGASMQGFVVGPVKDW
ncbi:hypothetical protein DPMN_178016 [Dreissena polymorpha]|uniref:Peptidase A2 domain-containing protein n=1 Tax=Dreissena polymorpha TaxID=45954 RepID=A0A9D4IJH4_DREPO|nr:hypothetical protein DPMN_178016 [Dreissena polymorpha]